MRAFEYSSATTLAQAASLVNGAVRPLAGGTDLLPLMKADVAAPRRLVDIKRIPELRAGIVATEAGVTIGALTPLSAIASDAIIGRQFAALAQAAALAATPQLRNMATLGGNLLQRPRCWYFRAAQFHCWLKGGGECHAREGQNQFHAVLGDSPCVATHASDPPAALIALDASIQTNRRAVAASDFFVEPSEAHRLEHVLEPDELVVAVRLPASSARSTYLKAMNRQVWAFALVGVAAALQLDGTTVTAARLVLNGVAPVPWRAEVAERELLHQELSERTIARAADAAVSTAHPLARNGYKVPLARALVGQALRAMRPS